jgi:uncharacterized protein (DUF2235 family)
LAKNLVFCADGTWNGPDVDFDDDGTPDPTNVLKAFEMLSGALAPGYGPGAKEQEKVRDDGTGGILQHAKYLHGVGDNDNRIIHFLGGIAGAGMEGRIIRGFTYLSRNHVPGDRIYLIGFSRGAYTVRALAGMVARVGLLNPAMLNLADKELAYRYGIWAWVRYRRTLIADNPTLRAFEQKGVTVPPEGWIPNVPVRAVGVWDTVGALGIPLYSPFDGHRLESIQFANHHLDPKVHTAFHALAVDERRADFTPTLWDPRIGVEQVWFAGAHGDVGGGYPARESLLSNIPLAWMLGRLRVEGLLLADDGTGLPSDVAAPIHRPWLEGIWRDLPKAARRLPDVPRLHVSLYERKAALGARYSPRPLMRFTVDGQLDPKYRA